MLWQRDMSISDIKYIVAPGSKSLGGVTLYTIADMFSTKAAIIHTVFSYFCIYIFDTERVKTFFDFATITTEARWVSLMLALVTILHLL